MTEEGKKKQRRSGTGLSLHPLSLEEALKGTMETGRKPAPENTHAKRTATKRRLKGEEKGGEN